MEKGDIVNVVFLCIINVTFMIAGIFLNSVVIISLWRSRQLRKKLCYFMVLVLSCFDLTVVSVTHPLVITSTIYFPIEGIQRTREDRRALICFTLCGLSMFALLTLNIERFLALTCPYFHQAFVTKERLVGFLASSSTLVIGLSPLLYINIKTLLILNVLAAICLSLMLFLSTYANYRMFLIAKSKRVDKMVAPLGTATSKDTRKKKRTINFKNISTCSLAVACYFLCCCPYIAYLAFRRLGSEEQSYDGQVLFFNLWATTFGSVNSTLNCVIFFWRNSVLRHEGMKIIKALNILNF